MLRIQWCIKRTDPPLILWHFQSSKVQNGEQNSHKNIYAIINHVNE